MTPLIKGIILGLALAAPVGPIGILCIRKTLNFGRLVGFISGLGAATADAIYGSFALFGLTIVSQFLIKQSLWIHLIGSLFLFYLAFITLKKPVKDTIENESMTKMNYILTFGSTLFLTLTNPMTIVSFIGIIAGMSTGTESKSSIYLVLGVFLGSAIWWLFLSYIIGFFRRATSHTTMKLINTISSLILFGFGIYSFFKSLSGLFN